MISRYQMHEGSNLNRDSKLSGPKHCVHCKSENLIGPFKYGGSWVHITMFTQIYQNAFICVDCGFTMLFTREGQERKVRREADLQNRKKYEF